MCERVFKQIVHQRFATFNFVTIIGRTSLLNKKKKENRTVHHKAFYISLYCAFRIKVLPPLVFENLNSLETLNLQNNKISHIPEDVIENVVDTLRHIDITGNKIYFPLKNNNDNIFCTREQYKTQWPFLYANYALLEKVTKYILYIFRHSLKVTSSRRKTLHIYDRSGLFYEHEKCIPRETSS